MKVGSKALTLTELQRGWGEEEGEEGARRVTGAWSGGCCVQGPPESPDCGQSVPWGTCKVLMFRC